MRTRDCDAATRSGRLRKAAEFFDSARTLVDLTDDSMETASPVVALLVLSAIASADVICCARLGVHAKGENHAEAVALLRTADQAAANALSRALDLKSKAEYTAARPSAADVRIAERAAAALLEMAREV